MRLKVFSLFLLVALLLSACVPQATPAATPVTALPTQTAPAVVPAEDPTASPTQPEVEAQTLTVLAAASLTESFTELGDLFETQNAGVTVQISFAGSQQLAQQLEQGAAADVFASASKKYMEAAVESKRVTADAARTFVKNRLVVIVPKDNPGAVAELKDLAKTGLKLDLADKSVPVGQYSLDFLDKASQDAAFDPQFRDHVLKNVVSYEDNVKAVVTKISLGEADAGIVYVTDITPEAAAAIATIEIPDALNTIATYPIAPIADSQNSDLAQAFVDLVLSPEGQAVMARYGFIPAAPDAAAAAGITVTDALGRQVTFASAPQKIVLVGKGVIMIADAVYAFPGAGDNIVALGSTAQGSGNFVPMIDPNFTQKTVLESNSGPEQIAAAQPDCVIMKSSNEEKLGKPLEELNIPVVYLDFETPDQYERDFATLGQLFQNPARAAEIAAFYQEKVAAVTQAVSGLSDDQKPRALVLYYSDKDGSVAFNIPPLSWMQTVLITTAGGAPVWQDANPSKGWTKVSLEQVAAWNPDIIFVAAYFNPANEVVAGLKADPQWQALEAVKNGNIYAFASDVYSWDQPDTRWILGLEWVAAKLHPDLFPAYDIQNAAQDFYATLYGMDEAAFEKNIQPILKGE